MNIKLQVGFQTSRAGEVFQCTFAVILQLTGWVPSSSKRQ